MHTSHLMRRLIPRKSTGGSSKAFVLLLCSLFHVAFNVYLDLFRVTVCHEGDEFSEMTEGLAYTIVGHLDLSLLAWLDGSLGIFRIRAAAGGHSLVDD